MSYESNIAVFWKESQEKRSDDGSKTGDDDSKKPREGCSGSYTEFLTIKFDKLEKERKINELINSLQIEVSSLKVEVKNLEKKEKSRWSEAILA